VQKTRSDQRAKLIQQVTELAGLVIFGSLSEIYRTCGNPGCRCHGPGPKHGPHLQVVYRGESGKTTGYYVPIAAQAEIRQGAAAWRSIQEGIRELATLNKEGILERARSLKKTREPKSPGTPARDRRPRPRRALAGS
jgi:hypothetical protein